MKMTKNGQGDADSMYDPPPSWNGLLVEQPLLEVLFEVYGLFKHMGEEDDTTSIEIFDCILQMASVQPRLFLNATQRANYLSRLVTSLVHVVSAPVSEKAGMERVLAERRKVAEVLQRLVLTWGVKELLLHSDLKSVLQLAAQVLCVPPIADRNDEELVEVEDDAIYICLDVWDKLVQGAKGPQLPVPADFGLVLEVVRQGACAVFQWYVGFRLQTAPTIKGTTGGTSDITSQQRGNDDSCDSVRVNQLQAVATLARFALETSLTCVCSQLQAVSQKCQAAPDSGASCAAQAQLNWLILLAGHILTNTRTSVSRLNVPPEVQVLCKTGGQVSLLVSCVNLVFQSVERENTALASFVAAGASNQVIKQKLWPDLSNTLMWFLARFSYTYLISETSQMGTKRNIGELGPIWQCYGETTEGYAKALDFIITKVCINLLHWTDNSKLAELSISVLDKLQKNVKNVTGRILASDWWWQLITGFAESGSRLHSLPRPLLLALTETIFSVCAAGVCTNAKTAQEEEQNQKARQAFSQILPVIEQRFSSIVQHSSFMEQYKSPGVLNSLLAVLTMMQGVASSGSRHTYELCYGFLCKYFALLLKLVDLIVLPHEAMVVLLSIVKAAGERVSPYMPEPQFREFCDVVSSLIGSWVVYNKKREQENARSNKADQTEEHQATDIEVLLEVLATVLSKEAQDLSRTGGLKDPKFPTDFTLSALNRLLPSFTTGILSYPSVCENYFELLEVTVSLHPDKFAQMEPSARVTLVESAKYAVRHEGEEKVVTAGLEIIKLIAVFHLETLTKRRNLTSPFGGDLVSFQQLLFDMLIFKPISTELLEPIADALLPLVIGDITAYQNMVQSFLQNVDASIRIKLEKGFADFLNSNGLTREMTTENQDRFRENLINFVQTVRALLQVN